MTIKNKELENIIEKNKIELNNKINNMNKTLNDKIIKEISNINDVKILIYKNIDECKNKILEIKNEIKLLDNNKLSCFENNKNEIIKIFKNIIEEEKFEDKLNIDNKINFDSIQSSDFDKRKLKKKLTSSNSKSKKNKNKSLDIKNKNNKIKSLNEGIFDNNLDYYIDSKNKLNYKPQNDNNMNNSENNNKSININSNKNISFLLNKLSNKKDPKEINTNIINNYKEDINNKNNILIKETSNYKNKFLERNNSNPNLIKFKTYSKENKTIGLKSPLKNILKLKINLQDINAQFNSEMNLKKSSSNENWNKTSKTINRIESQYFFPFTSGTNINKNINYEILSYKNKKEKMFKNFGDNNNLQDTFKLNNKNINSLFNIHLKKRRKNDKE